MSAEEDGSSPGESGARQRVSLDSSAGAGLGGLEASTGVQEDFARLLRESAIGPRTGPRALGEGDTIANRYTIERRLGQGGMGVVYLARQLQLNRKVVVKTLRGAVQGDATAGMRFEREAMGLSQLDHPNVVTIHDFGHEGEVAYLVMEYVDGVTLQRRLNELGTFELRAFLPVAIQTLDAVGEAHHLGIVHRDIKPQNIMLCERPGRGEIVKVLDFGLAKLMTSEDESITHKDNVIGTTAFMAPERMTDKANADQRVDVYALGVMFYYMLCGAKPFVGDDNLEILYKHVHAAPQPLAERLPEGHDIPAELIELVHHCMAKNPDDRPRDANEILELLNRGVDTGLLAELPGGLGASVNARLHGWPPEAGRVEGAPSEEFEEVPIEPLEGAEEGSEEVGEGARGADSHQFIATTESTAQLKARGIEIAEPSRELEAEATGQLGATPPGAQGGRHRLVGAAVAVLLVAGLGALGALMLGEEGRAETNTPPAEQGAAAGDGVEVDRVAQVLDRAEESLQERKLAQADALLEAVVEDARADPSDLARHAELKVSLEQARRVERARQRERDGDIDGALDAWRAVLEAEPSHVTARREFDRLQARRAEGAAPAGAVDEASAGASAEADEASEVAEAQPDPPRARAKVKEKSSRPRARGAGRVGGGDEGEGEPRARRRVKLLAPTDDLERASEGGEGGSEDQGGLLAPSEGE